MSLDQNTIDSIVDRKLAMMEAEYQLVHKYDNPDYKGVEQPIQEVAPQLEVVPELDQPVDNPQSDEDDEFQEYQGYEKMNGDSDDEEKINYDEIEHIDPFSKPLDVELIKKCMAEIELPTPPWAQNMEGWQNRIKEMKQL